MLLQSESTELIFKSYGASTASSKACYACSVGVLAFAHRASLVLVCHA